MTFALKPYQLLLVEHMRALPRCALWADMGMGKTLATLTALDTLTLTEDVFPVLVLAPKRVAVSVWPQEVAKWAHLHHMTIGACVGTAKYRTSVLEHGYDIVTMNYDNLPWLVKLYEKKPWPFRTIVADESTRLKGYRTRQGGARAKALAKVARQVTRFIELTGTPAPNGVGDLWGQAWFLDFGERLGLTHTAFQDRWFKQSYNGFDWSPMPHAFDEITKRLQDVCLTVKAKDWFDVREPIVNNLYVDLPPAARAHYRDMEKKLFVQLESIGIEAFNAATMTGKCHQIANGAIYSEKGEWENIHDEKLQALESVVCESNGSPLLVVYTFKSDFARLLQAFPQAKTLEDHDAERRWNKGEIPLLLAHPASAGHGLNLQLGGHRIVFFSVDWNLETHQQVIERVGPVRQLQAGFDRAVYITHILARDTIDEQILERLETKASVQDVLTNAMKRRK